MACEQPTRTTLVSQHWCPSAAECAGRRSAHRSCVAHAACARAQCIYASRAGAVFPVCELGAGAASAAAQASLSCVLHARRSAARCSRLWPTAACLLCVFVLKSIMWCACHTRPVQQQRPCGSVQIQPHVILISRGRRWLIALYIFQDITCQNGALLICSFQAPLE